jgi:hypothetical protein
MTITQMHERLRQELILRIQRGALSVSLLSIQTGLAQAHVSNFLRKRRGLSKQAMDSVLAAQRMKAEDLLPSTARGKLPGEQEANCVPVVSHKAAFDPVIYPSSILDAITLPAGTLRLLRAQGPSNRLTWRRFVAVQVSPADAMGMEPVLMPEAFAVIDRHYNSLARYQPMRGSIFAVRNGAQLVLRYVDFHPPRLILRLHNAEAPSESIEIEPGRRPQDLVAGRVALVLNQT